MALHINNPAVERTVRELAALTGESMTDAIGNAATDRLQRFQPAREKQALSFDEWKKILRSYNLQPINEGLTKDEILGYGPDGIPEQW